MSFAIHNLYYNINYKKTRCKFPYKYKIRASTEKIDELKKPRVENVKGSFYVDHSCIDCDTCRWMAPNVFSRINGKSAVYQQPENENDRLEAMQALLSCPTYSIHVDKLGKGELKTVNESFPILIQKCENIFFCGFTNESSFAACSYLIKRSEGNILVDCPRFVSTLKNRIDELGGIKYIFLTHIDDVAGHDKWANYYNAKRIIHKYEVNRFTEDCEIKLKGNGPWALPDDLNMETIEIIHTPGHTRGSICLYHKPSKSMFTGDHLGYSTITEDATIFPKYNSAGIKLQIENVKKLMNYEFYHIFPGHNRSMHFTSLQDRYEQLKLFLKEEVYDQK